MRKALGEEREENEQLRMRLNDSASIAAIAPREPEDKLDPAPRELDVEDSKPEKREEEGQADDTPLAAFLPATSAAAALSLPAAGGSAAASSSGRETPRGSPTTRSSDGGWR